jgi:MarR family transcriptional regulator, 2-MHQ and catechol-resistance regulon repressor
VDHPELSDLSPNGPLGATPSATGAMEGTAIHLWRELRKAYRALQAHSEASLHHSALIESDFAVLESLLHGGPMRVGTIGRKVGLASASITAAVDRLERRCLVRRQGDQQDRRSRFVTLTAEASVLVARARAFHQAAMEESTAALSADERDQLLGLLRKWVRSVQRAKEEKPDLAISPLA